MRNREYQRYELSPMELDTAIRDYFAKLKIQCPENMSLELKPQYVALRDPKDPKPRQFWLFVYTDRVNPVVDSGGN